MSIGSLQLHQDLSPASWVVERLGEFGADVNSVVPSGFDAYLRLFHPASRFVDGEEAAVTWTQVAAANGRVVHAEMQWANVSGVEEHSGESAPGLWDAEPGVGTLPRTHAAVLADLLLEHTTTPDRVWFCVWEGWGGLWFHPVGRWSLHERQVNRGKRGRGFSRRFRNRRKLAPPLPRVQVPGRAYYLLSGPIEAIKDSMEQPPGYQSANLWWPDDHAWCVATDIDFSWTYLAGTEALADELTNHPKLEVIRTRLDHRITYDADTLNPPPEWQRRSPDLGP
jgi:hypothetical protein